ncbi:Tyrosine recombinase XerD [Bacillus sp. T2.9-1]|nr:Tyrosine recombinase XerD [Bacillus sp. T2.9-1]
MLNFFQLPRSRLVAFLSSWGNRPPTRQKGYLFSHKHFTHTLEERKDNEEALFVTLRAPHRMGVAQMRYVIKQISLRAKISKCIHPHQLRYSYATTLINNGAPLEVIQNLMGHEKSETTRIYAYLSGQLRRELYKKYF